MCPPHHCAGSLTSFSIIEGCSGAITPAASSPVTSDSPPPIWTSNSVTPDRASCWILPTIEVSPDVEFGVEAEALLEILLDAFPELGARRDGDDDLAFLLRRLDGFFPVAGGARLRFRGE